MPKWTRIRQAYIQKKREIKNQVDEKEWDRAKHIVLVQSALQALTKRGDKKKNIHKKSVESWNIPKHSNRCWGSWVCLPTVIRPYCRFDLLCHWRLLPDNKGPDWLSSQNVNDSKISLFILPEGSPTRIALLSHWHLMRIHVVWSSQTKRIDCCYWYRFHWCCICTLRWNFRWNSTCGKDILLVLAFYIVWRIFQSYSLGPDWPVALSACQCIALLPSVLGYMILFIS